MSSFEASRLAFEQYSVTAKLIAPSGELLERPIEIRVNPVTGRTSRIAFSRVNEKEAGGVPKVLGEYLKNGAAHASTYCKRLKMRFRAVEERHAQRSTQTTSTIVCHL